MESGFGRSLEEANSSSLPCLNRLVSANGFLVEQQPIGMAPDELALETSDSRDDVHDPCVDWPGGSCSSCIG
jgi:hypothetical protein